MVHGPLVHGSPLALGYDLLLNANTAATKDPSNILVPSEIIFVFWI